MTENNKMPGWIVIGRFGGYRGAKDVSPDVPCTFVDCRGLQDPRSRSKDPLKLSKIKEFLLEQQPHETSQLVDRVVQGVMDGEVVCVKCRMGRHRSQAVAAIAADVLRERHPSVVFRGPSCLANIKRTA